RDPFGDVIDTPMAWDIERDGVYRASFIAENEGVYDLLVDVASAAAESNRDATEKQVSFMVAPSLREFTRAGRDAGLLGRIAAASGGSYIDISAVGNLPEAIEHTPNAYSRQVRDDLWDTPWLLMLLVVLLCLDWA